MAGNNQVPCFTRKFFSSGQAFSRIGDGALGGKAEGLIVLHNAIADAFDAMRFPDITVDVPVSVVLTTDVFDAFLERNQLTEPRLTELSDDHIGLLFQESDLPVEYLGDLRALVEDVHTPLAVRSSSRLEDAMFRPFAGVYQTKMIPNNQPDSDVRFRKLVEAIKFVFASVFSAHARDYLLAAGKKPEDEKMAVIIQEVVGDQQFDRFYPHLSGVARSYNFYPVGTARPHQGVVEFALGLGKTIVDGGTCWTYSPAHPKSPPPFASVGDQMKNTQLTFWAVNMGPAQAYSPLLETEYLVESDLGAAELDGSLRYLASTFDPARERLVPGMGIDGPRVLNFAPLLDMVQYPVNDVIVTALSVCEEALRVDVEVEFAMTFPQTRDGKARLAFLQVRPMVVANEPIDITESDLARDDVLLASDRAMGNGSVDDIRDIIYVKPDTFEARFTPVIAEQIESHNRRLFEAGRPYLMIGFGRWGSSDPWLGIPVVWSQVSGARVIVEASLPDMNVEPSQGAHFFHNISSFGISYLSVSHEKAHGVDWAWLDARPAEVESAHVRHIRLGEPLRVKVDGRVGRGAVWHP